MAALGDTAFTLEEWRKRLNPDDNIDVIMELLAKDNEMLTDMMFMEGNLPTGHRTTIRTGLPGITWRKLNQGVQPTKSTTVQVDETCGMCEGYSEVDKALADLANNTQQFRASEDKAFFEAFNQEMATKMIYGDSSLNPEQPLGLAPRYPYKDAPNVVDFGGSGADTTSIWIVVWGDQTVSGIFPKGSTAGLSHTDKGQVTIGDATNGYYEGYRSHYKWDIGLAVRDWRYAVRCCNIESAGLTGSGTNNITDKLYLLIQARNKIPKMNMGRIAIYCNEDVQTQFDVAAYNKTTPAIYSNDSGGKPQTYFMGIPVRRSDAILSTETALIATP